MMMKAFWLMVAILARGGLGFAKLGMAMSPLCHHVN
jgi:hypothetical protein